MAESAELATLLLLNELLNSDDEKPTRGPTRDWVKPLVSFSLSLEDIVIFAAFQSNYQSYLHTLFVVYIVSFEQSNAKNVRKALHCFALNAVMIEKKFDENATKCIKTVKIVLTSTIILMKSLFENKLHQTPLNSNFSSF